MAAPKAAWAASQTGGCGCLRRRYRVGSKDFVACAV